MQSTRERLETEYLQKCEPGRRMRKNPAQMKILKDEFDRNSKWSFEDKIRIASLVNMTHYQVAKWNWDHSQKQGVSTKRRKKQ